MADKTRAKYICQRWISVFVLAVFCASFMQLISSFFKPDFMSLVTSLGIISEWQRFLYGFGLGYIYLVILVKSKVYSDRQPLLDRVRYPSVVWAAFLVAGVAIVIHFARLFNDIDYAVLFELTGFVTGFHVYKYLKHFMPSSNTDNTDNTVVTSEISPLSDYTSLKKWLESKGPLTSDSEDIFGETSSKIGIVAERVAGFVNDDTVRNIAVFGEHGSGKTSLIHLVENRLKEDRENRYVVCRIHAWNIEPKNIPAIILRSIVDELSHYADCSSLISLPEDYEIALKHTKVNILTFLGTLAKGGEALDFSLKRLNILCLILRIKVVVVVEDLDRGMKMSEIEKYIPSILEKFVGYESITSILCMTLQDSFLSAIHRVFDKAEQLNIYEIKDIEKTGKKAFQLIVDSQDKVINLNEKYIRSKDTGIKIHKGLISPPFFRLKSSSQNIERSDSSVNDHYVFHLFNLIDTPRKFKYVFRQFDKNWKNLYGEIDPEELIVLTALKLIAPDVFNFIGSNIDDIRFILSNVESYGVPDSSLSESDQINKKKKKIDDLIAKQNFPINRESYSCMALLDFLFPCIDDHSQRNEKIFQVVRKNSPQDYFKLFNLGVIPDDHIRDQVVMEKLKAISVDLKNVKNIINFLLNKKYTAYFENYFSLYFDFKNIQILCSIYFQEVLNGSFEDEYFSESDKYGSWFFSLRIAYYDLDKVEKYHESWYGKEVRKALKINWRFANDISIWFGCYELNSQLSEDLLHIYKKSFIDYFSKQVNSIVDVIPNDEGTCAYQFFNSYCLSKNGEKERLSDDDKSYAKKMLELLYAAVDENPKKIMPQFIPLIFSIEKHRSFSGRWESSVLAINEMFDQREKIIRILIKYKAELLSLEMYSEEIKYIAENKFSEEVLSDKHPLQHY